MVTEARGMQTQQGTEKAHRTMNPAGKRLYDLKEAANYLGRPVWGVRTMIWNGKIPFIQDGRKQYIDIRDLDRYIENNKTITEY